MLDPFLGSGSTAVAAVRSGWHFVGYDLDESYVKLAEARVERERRLVVDPGGGSSPSTGRAGRSAKETARSVIEAAGFTAITEDRRQPGGVVVGFTARDRRGDLWIFDPVGGLTTYRPGLERAEVLWKALGKAAALREAGGAPLVWLSAQAPSRGPAAEVLRRVVGPGKPVHALIEMLKPTGLELLRALCEKGRPLELRWS